jgi:hypothetical protein
MMRLARCGRFVRDQTTGEFPGSPAAPANGVGQSRVRHAVKGRGRPPTKTASDHSNEQLSNTSGVTGPVCSSSETRLLIQVKG